MLKSVSLTSEPFSQQFEAHHWLASYHVGSFSLFFLSCYCAMASYQYPVLFSKDQAREVLSRLSGAGGEDGLEDVFRSLRSIAHSPEDEGTSEPQR